MEEADGALLDVLRPAMAPKCKSYGFSMHNRRGAPVHQVYGIHSEDTLCLRSRTNIPPGYSPHTQGSLKEALGALSVARSVLLPDSRLEMLLTVGGKSAPMESGQGASNLVQRVSSNTR